MIVFSLGSIDFVTFQATESKKKTEDSTEMLQWAVVCGFLALAVHLYGVLVRKPRKLRSVLVRQGIRGPPPRFLLGNFPDIERLKLQQGKLKPPHLSHDWPSRAFPHIHKWRNEYGPVFLYALGNLLHVCVTDPEMVREFSRYTSWDLGKPAYLLKERGPLLGEGIIASNASHWVRQRKIIAPEFFAEKLKGMVDLMVDSTMLMLRSWEDKLQSAVEGPINLRVDEDIRCLTADIISRVSFGSNFSKGKEIFSNLRDLQDTMSKVAYGVPGLRYVPTKNNRKIRQLEKKIDSSILMVVNQQGGSQENLLQVILEAAKSYRDDDGKRQGIDFNKFIIHNCKNIYFAGHETTSITVSWCLLLLAAYPEWQDRVRDEVLGVCGDGVLDFETLPSLKSLTMVIRETLRLYPPAISLTREALKDLMLGDLHIPKGALLTIPISIMHQNPAIWGSDAHEFNPRRFDGGIIEACTVPQCYIPFGSGPRICVGQNFAMVELRVMLSLILSKFQFFLSPQYHHSPVVQLVLQPEHGVHLLLKRLG